MDVTSENLGKVLLHLPTVYYDFPVCKLNLKRDSGCSNARCIFYLAVPSGSLHFLVLMISSYSESHQINTLTMYENPYPDQTLLGKTGIEMRALHELHRLLYPLFKPGRLKVGSHTVDATCSPQTHQNFTKLRYSMSSGLHLTGSYLILRELQRPLAAKYVKISPAFSLNFPSRRPTRYTRFK